MSRTSNQDATSDKSVAHLSVQLTGLGYEYVRDRANGTDDTVYLHQLVALLDHPSAVVFDSETDIHHQNSIPWDNRPANLEPLDSYTHRVDHLQNR